MQLKQSKQYYLDQEFESYRSFFDHAWARQFLDEADKTGLSDLAFNLCECWKGAANTAMLPWLVVTTLGSFAEGFCNGRKPYASEFLDALANRGGSQIRPPLTQEQQRSLRQGIDVINTDLQNQLRLNPFQFDRREAWNELRDQKEFAIALLASQRIVYAAIYYGYEDFVLSCYRRATGLPHCRVGPFFHDKLAKHYNAHVAHEVWKHSDVETPRLVRNAIVHNGARETRELANIAHSIGVIDGTLQMTPTVTRVAFNCLKDRAFLFLRETGTRLPVPART